MKSGCVRSAADTTMSYLLTLEFDPQFPPDLHVLVPQNIMQGQKSWCADESQPNNYSSLCPQTCVRQTSAFTPAFSQVLLLQSTTADSTSNDQSDTAAIENSCCHCNPEVRMH